RQGLKIMISYSNDHTCQWGNIYHETEMMIWSCPRFSVQVKRKRFITISASILSCLIPYYN
ncbi:MAG TPA: hypothetical protein VFV08_15115, partial [Puia sp.]|nr:hypothetical protein [Puia sp.]